MSRSFFLLFAILLSLISFACSKGSSQIGGIVGEVRFNTQACVPQQKIVNIRNDDTANPQRVMGVYFEFGTNDKNNFKIDKVLVGTTEYTSADAASQKIPIPAGGIALDVLIPAGGIMSSYVTYKPRKTGNHLSYLDFFLNGPQLGIIQVRTIGDAPTAAEGCGKGQEMTFNVTKATMQISKPGSAFDNLSSELEVTGNFRFLTNGENKATIDKEGFPKLTFRSEALRSTDLRSDALDITLEDDTFEGTFTDNKLTFDNLKLKASILLIQGVSLKSENFSIAGDNGASLSLNGSPLTESGDLKVTLGVKVQGFNQALDGAAIGVTLELKKQNQ